MVIKSVTILKEKKGVATKIRVDGKDYALIHEDTAKGKKQ